jgi:hypothetical protein
MLNPLGICTSDMVYVLDHSRVPHNSIPCKFVYGISINHILVVLYIFVIVIFDNKFITNSLKYLFSNDTDNALVRLEKNKFA